MLEPITLTKPKQNKFVGNLRDFLAPVAIVYIVALIGIINANGGAFKPTDLIPTPFTWGAGLLYILNSALDYLRKLRTS